MSQIDKWNGIENPEITGEKKDYNISNKNVDNIVGIINFVNDLEILGNYEDFINLKKEINEFILEFFKEKLSSKNNDFNLAFSQGNISKYQPEHESNSFEELNELRLFLQEKNKFYLDIISKILTLGKLDKIISSEEKNDLYMSIESGVFQYLDEIYINWYESTYTESHQEKDELNNLVIKTEDGNPKYGGLINSQFVGYKEFSKKSDLGIDDSMLLRIKNKNLKQYLLSFSTFIKTGIINYHTWVAIDEFGLNTWKNRESNIGLVTPIENYNHKTLIEPELLFFLRNKNKLEKFDLKSFGDLSAKYYDENDFGMDSITLDFVESILEGGEAIFSGFIGKAFPNDDVLSKRVGSSILLKDNAMNDIVENSQKGLKNLFGEDYIFDKQKLYNELLKEVIYHEYGHSLFIKGNRISKMEEAKATLFYYLKVFDEDLHDKEYLESDISRIVEFTIMDSIRNLERINQERSFKYVVLTKINLRNLFSSKLVYFEGGTLKINPSREYFDKFNDLQVGELENIQELYNKTDDEIRLEDEIYIKKLDEDMQENIEKMIRIINK